MIKRHVTLCSRVYAASFRSRFRAAAAGAMAHTTGRSVLREQGGPLKLIDAVSHGLTLDEST